MKSWEDLWHVWHWKQHGKRMDFILLMTQLQVSTLQPLAQSDTGTNDTDADTFAFNEQSQIRFWLRMMLLHWHRLSISMVCNIMDCPRMPSAT